MVVENCNVFIFPSSVFNLFTIYRLKIRNQSSVQGLRIKTGVPAF